MTDAPARATVIGAGPAGLMAAETLLARGVMVDLFDAMPSVGRKFLLAGKGGLNLTHSEALPAFVSRYGERADVVARWLAELGPQALRDWALGLGISTFVGSSGRVFPQEMKAAPLLRAWLHRLREAGLKLHMRHRWLGWRDGDAALTLRFAAPVGEVLHDTSAVVLALGGASWARLGSDGAWVPWLAGRGVVVAPLQPSNCGFDIGWSPYFAQRHAGTPLKNVRLRFTDAQSRLFDRLGECVITATGLEGPLVYAASALLRDEISALGAASLTLDLVPQHAEELLSQRLAKGRAARSLPNHLREQAGLHGATLALLRERWSAEELQASLLKPAALAHELKAWPLLLKSARPIDEAISTAGGVALPALDEALMAKALPGVFCAGEMLDWEAPTGGYLLTASMASGRVAGEGAARWCQHKK